MNKNKFLDCWNKNKGVFGKSITPKEIDFGYYVEIFVPIEIKTRLKGHIRDWQKFWPNMSWVHPEKYSITIALPARAGSHFQGNQESFMKNVISGLVEKYGAFRVQIGMGNVFENSIFREVYDLDGVLSNWHQSIMDEIPFAQSPAFSGDNFLPHITVFRSTETLLLDDLALIRDVESIDFMAKTIILGKVTETETGLKKGANTDLVAQ